jgi:hypothetical protein
MTLRWLLPLVVPVLASYPIAAHHSFAAEYEADKPVQVSGTVSKVEWMNPHVYFTIESKEADGAVTAWRFEGYPPNMLVRQGWKRDATLKPGMPITVSGWRSRLDPHHGAGRQVTFADGSKLWMGPPAGTGGQ